MATTLTVILEAREIFKAVLRFPQLRMIDVQQQQGMNVA